MTSSLSVSELFHRTVKTVRKAALPLAQIVGAGQVIVVLLSVLCMGPSPFEMNAQAHPVGYFIWCLGVIPASVIMMTAALLALKEARAGKRARWKPVLKAACQKFWPVLGIMLLMMLALWAAVLILTVALIAAGAGIYMLSPDAATVFLALVILIAAPVAAVTAVIYFTFSIYAVALGDCGALSALKHAHKMIKGRFWGTFGLCLVTGVAVAALSAAIGVVQMTLMPLYFVNVWLGAAFTWLLSIPFAVVNSAAALGAASEVYADRKARSGAGGETQTQS